MGENHSSTSTHALKYTSVGFLTFARKSSSGPYPAFFWTKLFNLIPKSLREVGGQSLREKVLMGNFYRHNQSLFLVLLARLQLQLRRALFISESI